jgi:hypothetical protein
LRGTTLYARPGCPRAFAPSPVLQLLALAAALSLNCVAAGSTPTTVGPIVISVPDGFQPFQTQRLKKSLVAAWTKSVRKGTLKTLLQVNVVDLGKSAASADPSRYAEKYLQQFLSEIEHRRSHYAVSPVSHVVLAGLPAVRASWNGSVGDNPAVGVMYSVVVQNRYAVVFHTQDLGTLPTTGMLEAMQAIEAVSQE